jgi:peptidoglycan hydrolase CwlO-like protein
MSKLKDIFQNIGSLDSKSVSFLIKALESNNVAGFDYLEFKQSLETLKQMDMDEEVAVKSAFATASTMGLTKKKLLDSASFYQKVLKSEKDKFNEAHKKQVQKHVTGKKEKISKLQEKIDEINNKIKELEQKVSSYKEVIEKARKDIDNAQERIDQRKEKFEQAYHALDEEISDDKASFEEKL